MVMRALLRCLALAVTATLATGCLDVIGTSKYQPCDDEDGDGACDDGSGGGSPTTSGSTSGTGSTTSSGTTCFDVTVNVSGDVKVHLSSIDVDFEQEFAGPICAPAGSLTLSAECDQSGGDDPPVAVDWGNDACDDDTTSCTIDLQAAATFTVTAGDCP